MISIPPAPSSLRAGGRPALRVISLGAGWQSTTMALMADRGELGPVPDCAIFADTGWEPRAVYEHLAWLETELSFPVHHVSAGDLRADTIAATNSTGQRFAAVPWHTLSPRGKPGMGRRQCTKEYKLRPIQRKVVELLGGRPRGGCIMMIGISRDEVHRMKPSRVRYIVNEWPLVTAGIDRRICGEWLVETYGRQAPRSACLGCPYHSDTEWRGLTSEEFAETAVIDRAIRDQTHRGIRSQQFMHRSRLPLDQVDLSTAEERGQGNLFANECEGLCGV